MLTVAWERVQPFVQCRVEVCDEVLLPFRVVGMARLRARLVDRILWSDSIFELEGSLPVYSRSFAS